MHRLAPKEIQVTLADGKVLDFQTALGDKITLHEVNTQQKGDDTVHIHYYQVLIVAKEDRHDGYQER